MRPDLCHAGLVVALEHQAWPVDPCSLQHFIGLFAGVVELSATLNRAAQEVVHAHPREADCVFQDFDAFFGVEGPHLFQRFYPGRDVEVVVIAQSIGEGAHAVLFERSFALGEL